MGREPAQKEIDGIRYTFGRHRPKDSLKLFNRILKIAAPAITAAIDKKSINDLIYDGSKDTDVEIDLAGAITTLCSITDEPEVEEILDKILDQVLHNGDGTIKGMGNCRENYDAVFMDTGVLHVYKVVGTALGVEYDNFFGKGANLGAMLKKARDMIPGKPQSNGTSGD